MNNLKNYMKVPENTLILGENQYYSKNCYETQLNNNVLVVGTSGAGKTRSIVKPNLMQASGSYVISDPKGNLAREMGPYLEAKGYKVLCMDFIHPEKSLHYDPLYYCRSTKDINKLAHTLVYEMNKAGNVRGKGSSYDPFWDESSVILISSIIGYLKEKQIYDYEEISINMLVDIIKLANRNQKGVGARNRSSLDLLMEQHKEIMKDMGEESWAFERYCQYNTAPDRTQATINICVLAKLATFDSREVRELFKKNDIDFTSIGKEPTALFVQISDTDRSMDIIANLFYSQLISELCRFADDECENSCLPVPTQFILDDFSTNCRIDNFENIISNTRSRCISFMLMIQSESQLEAGYGENARTIIDNCNTYVYMGGSNVEQANEVALRANKSSGSVLNMPLSTSWIFRRGQEPVLCKNFDLEWFQKEKDFVPGMAQSLEDSKFPEMLEI